MRGFFIVFLTTCLSLFPHPLHGGVPYTGSIAPGFEGSQMNYINNNGIFLESNSSAFGFGFITTPDSVTLFTLSIVHKPSSRLIWSANRASPVSNSDKLQFQDDGAVVLRSEGGSEVWKLENSGKNASRIELRDSGNLVVVSGDGTSIWESFDHPTDTLITNQVFKQGMRLTSNPSSSSNMTYALEIESGDMVLSVDSLTPQVYWSMGNDRGRIIEKDGVVTSSSLLGNVSAKPTTVAKAQGTTEAHLLQRSSSPLYLSSSVTKQSSTESTQLHLSNAFAPLLECCAG